MLKRGIAVLIFKTRSGVVSPRDSHLRGAPVLLQSLLMAALGVAVILVALAIVTALIVRALPLLLCVARALILVGLSPPHFRGCVAFVPLIVALLILATLFGLALHLLRPPLVLGCGAIHARLGLFAHPLASRLRSASRFFASAITRRMWSL